MKVRDGKAAADLAAEHDDSNEGWPVLAGGPGRLADVTRSRLEAAEADVLATMYRLAALEDIVEQFLKHRELDHVSYEGAVVPRELISDLMQHTLHDITVAKRRCSTIARRLNLISAQSTG